jgi:hypothetical protein
MQGLVAGERIVRNVRLELNDVLVYLWLQPTILIYRKRILGAQPVL